MPWKTNRNAGYEHGGIPSTMVITQDLARLRRVGLFQRPELAGNATNAFEFPFLLQSHCQILVGQSEREAGQNTLGAQRPPNRAYAFP